MTFLAASQRPDRRALRLRRAINARVFTAYGEQLLVPTLEPGDIVIMDNRGSHKGTAVRKAIRNRHPAAHRIPPRCLSPQECANYFVSSG